MRVCGKKICILKGVCDTLVQPDTEPFLSQKRVFVVIFKCFKATLEQEENIITL